SESKLISAFFEHEHPGPLTSVEASGDVHAAGQATHVLTFESGAKLAYKPRSLAMERCYYDLIGWLNERGLKPELKLIGTLDAGGFSDKPEDWVDLSALGHGDEQLTPMPVASWAQAETDRMRLIYERVTMPPGLSLPRFDSQQVQAAAYADEVVRGFARTYAFLRKFKAEPMAPQGPVAAFVGKP